MDQSKSQVFRCYVRKRPGFDVEAQALCRDLREQLGAAGLERLTIVNRYDMEGVPPEVYRQARGTVFSEPQVDAVYDGDFPRPEGPCALLAVEALPGQFDQRSDSAAQCVQLMTGGARPLIAYAKLYALEGEPLPEAGEYSVILDSRGEAVCVILTDRVAVVPYGDVGREHARREGGQGRPRRIDDRRQGRAPARRLLQQLYAVAQILSRLIPAGAGRGQPADMSHERVGAAGDPFRHGGSPPFLADSFII